MRSSLLMLVGLAAGCHRLLDLEHVAAVDGGARADDAVSDLGDAPEQETGLIAHYPLDGIVSFTLMDLGPSALHATCDEASHCPSMEKALLSNGARFDGVDDIAVVDNVAPLVVTSFSVAGWFRVDALDGLRCPLNLTAGTTLDSWQFCMLSGRATGQFSAAGADASLTSTTVLTAGAWYHLALRFDGTRAALFVNGTLEDEEPCGVGYSDPRLVIGADINNGAATYHFQGFLDDLRIYDRALSDVELAALAVR